MSGARCLWRRWCSGRRRVRPPARSPHASLRLGVVDLEARPCPPAPRPCCFVACGTAGVLGAVGPGACVVCLARPGCLVRSWAAARPRAVRAASFARRVVSKPGQAPPPPTGSAAVPSGPSGALRTGGACVAVCGGASPRSPAKPCRRPWVPQPGPPTPWPCCFVACGAAGVLGAVGSGRVAGLLGVPVGGGPPASPPRRELRSARRLEARPGPAPRLRAPQPGPPDPPTPSTPAALAALCVVELPLEARPGPAAAHGCCR